MMKKNDARRTIFMTVLVLLLVAALAACTPEENSGLGSRAHPMWRRRQRAHLKMKRRQKAT